FVDAAGNAYVTGQTDAADFPVTPNAYQTTFTGTHTCGDRVTYVCPIGFVAKLNPPGSAMLYATYLGGNGTAPLAIVADGSGNAYISGGPGANYPTTITQNGGDSLFITKLSADGSNILLSFLWGGWDYSDMHSNGGERLAG